MYFPDSIIRAVLLAGLLTAPVVMAAEQALAPADYDELVAARDLMDANNNSQAVNALNALLRKVYGDPYDEAVVLQTLGYAHLRLDLAPLAIQDFERALARKSLPQQPRFDVQRVLGRLYAANNEYDKARAVLEEWLATKSRDSSVEDYAALANVYAQLKDYDNGMGAIRKAIALSPTPEQNHYQLLLALQYQDKRYDEATATLQKMVGYWPQEKRYWTDLANTYLQQGDNKQAHVALKLAYAKGLLDEQNELLNLVRLGMTVGLPDHAARVLATGLSSNQIASTQDHWKLLAQAWIQANETEQAVDALDHVARFGGAGEFHLRQAELYMRENDWHKVLAYVDQALAAGGLKSPGKAYLLRGMAYTRLSDYRQSLAALDQAQQYSETASQALQWVDYVHQRQKLDS